MKKVFASDFDGTLYFYKAEDDRKLPAENVEKVKEYQEQIKDIDPENIVYVDESGINECLHREYGYAPRGEKVIASISGRKFQRTNIVAAKMGNQILAPMQYNGTTDAPLFEFWFEQWLLPCLPENAVIVMDNAYSGA